MLLVVCVRAVELEQGNPSRSYGRCEIRRRQREEQIVEKSDVSWKHQNLTRPRKLHILKALSQHRKMEFPCVQFQCCPEAFGTGRRRDSHCKHFHSR